MNEQEMKEIIEYSEKLDVYIATLLGGEQNRGDGDDES